MAKGCRYRLPGAAQLPVDSLGSERLRDGLLRGDRGDRRASEVLDVSGDDVSGGTRPRGGDLHRILEVGHWKFGSVVERLRISGRNFDEAGQVDDEVTGIRTTSRRGHEVVEVRYGMPRTYALWAPRSIRSRSSEAGPECGRLSRAMSMSTSVSRRIIGGTSWRVHHSVGRHDPRPATVPATATKRLPYRLRTPHVGIAR